MKECTNNVCGMRRVGGKGSEEAGETVVGKRRLLEEWLQRSH